MDNLAELFKVLGDPTRLNILKVLMEDSRNVTQIAEKLDMSVSAISHQLRVLKTHRLVKGIKEGKEVIYSLDDHHVHGILEMGQIHLDEVHHG